MKNFGKGNSEIRRGTLNKQGASSSFIKAQPQPSNSVCSVAFIKKEKTGAAPLLSGNGVERINR